MPLLYVTLSVTPVGSNVSPVKYDVLSGAVLSSTSVTSTGFTFTVDVDEYVLPSYVIVAVIVAVPSATPVTTPFSSTVATFVLFDVHVTALISGSLGSNVAVSCVVAPANISVVAGDTVTATYSLALAIGADPVYAAIIGNIAAGIVVKQFGCATTSIDEILKSMPLDIKLEI